MLISLPKHGGAEATWNYGFSSLANTLDFAIAFATSNSLTSAVWHDTRATRFGAPVLVASMTASRDHTGMYSTQGSRYLLEECRRKQENPFFNGSCSA